MQNISLIKSRLVSLCEARQVDLLLERVLATKELDAELKGILKEWSEVFLKKLIKHLESKRPGKSGISDLIQRSLLRLQHSGANENLIGYFSIIIVEIINDNFKDAFSNRLNVKSKEFLDLEDCEPF